MATVRGRCSNFDYCVVAERRIVLDVDVGAGAAFICPECGKALGAPPGVAGSGGRRFAALLGAAVLVLGGGVYGSVLLLPHPKDHSRLPPWLDPAQQTHAADSADHLSPAVVASAAPAPRVLPPPPHVPPVPPRPTQPTPSEPKEMALGSAALMPLVVTVANRLAAPGAAEPVGPPVVAPNFVAPNFVAPNFVAPNLVAPTFVMPTHLVLPSNQPASTQSGVSSQYHTLVDGTRRLAIGFHFASHSVALDEGGMRDLDRLVKYLASAHAQAGRVVLVGFSDNDGSRGHSLDVSRRRAAVVAALLAARGVTLAGSAAFGADLPAASNGSAAGRQRNRRVEVFVQE